MFAQLNAKVSRAVTGFGMANESGVRPVVWQAVAATASVSKQMWPLH